MNEKCKRIINWNGKIEIIYENEHAHRWTGEMPCTGVRKCVHCGEIENKE